MLLSHKRAQYHEKPLEDRYTPDAFYATSSWSAAEIKMILAGLTLDADTPLSCLAVETLPSGSPISDPLGANLGQERFLRTSPLVPIPAVCG